MFPAMGKTTASNVVVVCPVLERQPDAKLFRSGTRCHKTSHLREFDKARRDRKMIRRKPWLRFHVVAFLWRFNRRNTTESLVRSRSISKGMWRISPVHADGGEVCCYVVWRMIRNEARILRDGLLFGEADMLVDRLNGECTCHCHREVQLDNRRMVISWAERSERKESKL